MIIVADAIVGAGPYAKKAALINYEFLAHGVVTTDQIIKRLHKAKAAKSQAANNLNHQGDVI